MPIEAACTLLAHRLGMNTVKWELEDLAFATLFAKRYDEIVRLVAERAPSRDTYLMRVIERVSADLRAARVKATVTAGEERQRLFDRQAAQMPMFVEYQHKTSRQIPVLVLTRLD